MIKIIIQRLSILGVGLCIFLSLYPSPANAFTGSGSGTSGDPFLITSCAQLQEISSSLGAYYKQTRSINCAGTAFTPITGTFTGTLDGQNYTVNNISISSGGGIFNAVQGATIQNVNLASGSISGSGDVGSFVDSAGANTTFSHCFSNLTLTTGIHQEVGGFTGRIDSANVVIEKSAFTGNSTTSGFGSQGGLVGYISGNNTIIRNSYTTGTYTGGFMLGGLVGYDASSSNTIIQKSYSAATLAPSGAWFVGGLVGYFSSTNTISDSFAASSVSGTYDDWGAALGYGVGTATNVYFDATIAGTSNCISSGSATCTAVNSGNSTPNYFKNNSSNAPLSAWDFTTIWQTNASSYPTLRTSTMPDSTDPSNTSESSVAGSNTIKTSCADLPPVSTPDLFQIDTSNTQAILYFAPAIGPTNKYFISYGLQTGEERYGTEFNQEKSAGVISHKIEGLTPNTIYYFKIRGGNGCMPGKWSNEMKVITATSAQSKLSYYKNQPITTKSLLANTTATNKKTQKAVLGISANKNTCKYTVQTGDNLWNIAEKKLGSGTKFASIIKDNGLNSSLLLKGQILRVGCK